MCWVRLWYTCFCAATDRSIAIGQELSATTALSSGVPQGSIVGPLLFAMYVSPIDDIVCAHPIQYHHYADDLMLYTALAPSRFSDLSSIAHCIDAVSTWFMQNALLLNPGKTEAVIFGTWQHLASLDITGRGALAWPGSPCSSVMLSSCLLSHLVLRSCDQRRPRMHIPHAWVMAHLSAIEVPLRRAIDEAVAAVEPAPHIGHCNCFSCLKQLLCPCLFFCNYDHFLPRDAVLARY